MDMEKPAERIDDIKKAEAMAHAKNEIMGDTPVSSLQGKELLIEKYAGMEYDAKERVKNMSGDEINEENLRMRATQKAIDEWYEERREKFPK
jgi:hypothetical protein